MKTLAFLICLAGGLLWPAHVSVLGTSVSCSTVPILSQPNTSNASPSDTGGLDVDGIASALASECRNIGWQHLLIGGGAGTVVCIVIAARRREPGAQQPPVMPPPYPTAPPPRPPWPDEYWGDAPRGAPPA